MDETAMALTPSNIKYLLVISELDQQGRGVRCTDVAGLLHVTKPSVHRMTKSLQEMGLIHKGHYGVISFTDQGKLLSGRYCRCFEVICRHFSQLLPDTADVKNTARAVLAELSLEEVEHMCRKLCHLKETLQDSAV